MRRDLTPTEVDLLTEIVRRHGADASLADALRNGRLTDEDVGNLGTAVTEELARSGFDADYQPTAYGRQLEDIIDALVTDT